jgi:hypothetical protein
MRARSIVRASDERSLVGWTAGPDPIVLSWVVAALAGVAASIGLLSSSLYRDNEFVRSAWKGSDWVTLFVVVPLLVGSLSVSLRRSLRAQLVGLAALDYLWYGYAYYVFGARFNELFLIYVGIFALSMLGLVFGIVAVGTRPPVVPLHPAQAARWIAGYMLFVAGGLTVVYVAQSLASIVTGQPPPIVKATDGSTGLVFALDLAFLVPWQIIAAIWLWRGRAWGYFLATILNTKGALYTLTLAIGSIIASRNGIPAVMNEVPLWVGLTIANAAAAAWLLTHAPVVRIGRRQ